MEDEDCSVSIANLICQENGLDLDADDDGEEGYHKVIILLKDADLSETEEYMEKLVFRESSFESRNHDRLSCSDSYSSVVEEDWFKCVRLTSVQWIFKMRDYFHFSTKTAYLAVVYFDRFFVRRQIIDKGKLWAIRLLSVACLSLAAKMEECRVPALSDYQIDGYEFNSKAIQRMEILVLSTLEWRMSSVTPFDYLSYFAYKFQYQHEEKDFLHNAVTCIFAIAEVINVVDYRPSTIAAAALLAASSETYTKELLESKISSSSLSGSLEKDHVYTCYSIMRVESSKNLKRTKRGASSDLSANHSSVSDAIELADSASFTGLRDKRRRLQGPNIQ